MIEAILLDVEGTTTAVSFVSDVLFPYARARLGAALAGPLASSELREGVSRLHAEWDQDAAARLEISRFGDGVAYAEWLMDRDRKSTGLKQIQGALWEAGYREGAFEGHVFDDVPAALADWSRHGIQVCIFSSGSVRAQRLLFAHTRYGDLGKYLSGHFDTTTGSKREAASYTEIAARLGRGPGSILFLSDLAAELDAARAAGLRTARIEREPAAPGREASPGAETHPRFASLSQVTLGSGH